MKTSGFTLILAQGGNLKKDTPAKEKNESRRIRTRCPKTGRNEGLRVPKKDLGSSFLWRVSRYPQQNHSKTRMELLFLSMFIEGNEMTRDMTSNKVVPERNPLYSWIP